MIVQRLAWQIHRAIPPILNVGCESDPAEMRSIQGTVNLDIDRWHIYDGIFVQANAEALPFRDKSFATVALCECLDHMENPRLAIKEALRVARLRIIATLPADDGSVEHPDHWKEHINGLRSLGLIETHAGDLKLRHGHCRQWNRLDVENLFSDLCDFSLEGPSGENPPEWRVTIDR